MFKIGKQTISTNATFKGRKVGDMSDLEKEEMEKAIRERMVGFEIDSFGYVFGSYHGEVIKPCGVAGAFYPND